MTSLIVTKFQILRDEGYSFSVMGEGGSSRCVRQRVTFSQKAERKQEVGPIYNTSRSACCNFFAPLGSSSRGFSCLTKQCRPLAGEGGVEAHGSVEDSSHSDHTLLPSLHKSGVTKKEDSGRS